MVPGAQLDLGLAPVEQLQELDELTGQRGFVTFSQVVRWAGRGWEAVITFGAGTCIILLVHALHIRMSTPSPANSAAS